MWNLFGKKKKEGEHRTLQLITDKGMPFGYVEAYKSLRTNLDFMAGSMDVHTLVITSTVLEESKSNVAVNLALTMAESGKKVALVDCDLRKPVLHRYLKAGHNVKGVSNVLSNQCTLDEALQELKEMNLTFLPAGTPPPNPSEMLSQPQMQAMVDALREKFDFVIMDAPPGVRGHRCSRHRTLCGWCHLCSAFRLRPRRCGARRSEKAAGCRCPGAGQRADPIQHEEGTQGLQLRIQLCLQLQLQLCLRQAGCHCR